MGTFPFPFVTFSVLYASSRYGWRLAARPRQRPSAQYRASAPCRVPARSTPADESISSSDWRGSVDGVALWCSCHTGRGLDDTSARQRRRLMSSYYPCVQAISRLRLYDEHGGRLATALRAQAATTHERRAGGHLGLSMHACSLAALPKCGARGRLAGGQSEKESTLARTNAAEPQPPVRLRANASAAAEQRLNCASAASLAAALAPA